MKQLDEFPIHGNTKQDWPKLLDGKIYELEAGTDFTCKPQSFRSLALGQARKRGGTVTTHIVKETGNIVIQFIKNDEPVELDTDDANLED